MQIAVYDPIIRTTEQESSMKQHTARSIQADDNIYESAGSYRSKIRNSKPVYLFFYAFMSISALFLGIYGCTIIDGKRTPVSERGVLDLRGYDFNARGSLALSGEWEFYWGDFIDPSDLDSDSELYKGGLMHVPGSWSKVMYDGKAVPGFGSATFRLTIRHDLEGIETGIYVQEIETAYELFVDGKPLVKSGTTSALKADQVPVLSPRYEHFVPSGNETVLVAHVSNFNDPSGGIGVIRFGLSPQIEKEQFANIAKDFFIFGSLFLMGLYHLALFFLNRKEKSALFFGIFCLTLGLRTIIMGERALHSLFSFFGYEILIKIEYLTIPLAAVFFALYFYELFGYTVFDYVNKVFLGLSAAACVAIIVLPLVTYAAFFPIYQLCILGICVFVIVGLVLAIAKKRDGASVFLFGFAFLFLTVVNDILFSNRIINTGFLLPIGMIFFIFAQAVILLRKSVHALSSIEKLSARLVSLDKLKDAFLANTSHELRTPLYGIIGLAEGMRDGKMGRLTESQARSLSLIISSGRRLANLVNDILDFSTMKKKQLAIRKKPVDMKEITDVVFVFSHPILSNKSVVLENRIPADFPLVNGDEMRLQQVMHNLLGNAIKFTESGAITVTAERKGNMAYISVTDTGIGIPKDKIDAIFESFEQADTSVARTYGGTGIGLSIVRQIVELHGGQIAVQSEMGKGSTFTFGIPVSQEREKREAAEEEVAPARLIEVPEADYSFKTPGKEEKIVMPGGRRLKVLVVDDEPIHHEVIESQLDSEQFDLTHVLSGKDGITSAWDNVYDAILLDVMMPGVSGYFVCKKIRERYAKYEVPIIMLTAKNLVSDLVEGLEAGANDYVPKPIRRSELLARIKTHVQLANVNRAYSRFIPREFLLLLGRDSIVEVERGDQVQLELTILFCDIRGFMLLSETMTPRENFNFLNSYFEKMAPIIRKHNGYIDKYMGDGIMALFPKNPEDALKAALEMKKAVAVYNGFRGKVGYNPIAIGIGIHTGPIMLGTIGDETRMEGTVISDTVNIAARLEGLTKVYGGSIIISSAIFLSLEDPSAYNYRFLGLAQVKGKRDSVPVYEVFETEETGQRKLQTKDFFEKALQAFFRQEFANAEKAFFSVLELDPYDKAARLYYNRSKELKVTGVPEDWDGHETVDIK